MRDATEKVKGPEKTNMVRREEEETKKRITKTRLEEKQTKAIEDVGEGRERKKRK